MKHRPGIYEQPRKYVVDRPLVICDARYDSKTGLAAIACAGRLGTHALTIPVASNSIAEARAVLFAMDLALACPGPPERLKFYTDAVFLVQAQRLRGEQGELVNRIRRRLARWRQWDLEHVPRAMTAAAHQAAAEEWRNGLGGRLERNRVRAKLGLPQLPPMETAHVL